MESFKGLICSNFIPFAFLLLGSDGVSENLGALEIGTFVCPERQQYETSEVSGQQHQQWRHSRQ